jgi:hypothetical protein
MPSYAAFNTRDRRAMILTSSLDDFLISNLKEPPESQAKIVPLVERALRATRFGGRLPAPANRPPDMLGAAGLKEFDETWGGGAWSGRDGRRSLHGQTRTSSAKTRRSRTDHGRRRACGTHCPHRVPTNRGLNPPDMSDREFGLWGK